MFVWTSPDTATGIVRTKVNRSKSMSRAPAYLGKLAKVSRVFDQNRSNDQDTEARPHTYKCVSDSPYSTLHLLSLILPCSLLSKRVSLAPSILSRHILDGYIMPALQKQCHQPIPTIYHVPLESTFRGIEHPLSSPEAIVHQYLGIKYASVPARFRQSKLFKSYPPIVNASNHGCADFTLLATFIELSCLS